MNALSNEPNAPGRLRTAPNRLLGQSILFAPPLLLVIALAACQSGQPGVHNHHGASLANLYYIQDSAGNYINATSFFDTGSDTTETPSAEWDGGIMSENTDNAEPYVPDSGNPLVTPNLDISTDTADEPLPGLVNYIVQGDDNIWTICFGTRPNHPGGCVIIATYEQGDGNGNLQEYSDPGASGTYYYPVYQNSAGNDTYPAATPLVLTTSGPTAALRKGSKAKFASASYCYTPTQPTPGLHQTYTIIDATNSQAIASLIKVPTTAASDATSQAAWNGSFASNALKHPIMQFDATYSQLWCPWEGQTNGQDNSLGYLVDTNGGHHQIDPKVTKLRYGYCNHATSATPANHLGWILTVGVTDNSKNPPQSTVIAEWFRRELPGELPANQYNSPGGNGVYTNVYVAAGASIDQSLQTLQLK